MAHVDMGDLASRLFGTRRQETQEVSTDATTRTYSGVATSDSEDGAVTVDIGGDVTPPDDLGDEEWSGTGVEVPCGPAVEEGDEVVVTLVGGGALKSPMVTSASGSGDRERAARQQVEQAVATVQGDLATAQGQAQATADALAAIEADVIPTLATKVETDELGNRISEIEADYATGSDLSEYVKTVTYEQGLDGISQQVATAYTSLSGEISGVRTTAEGADGKADAAQSAAQTAQSAAQAADAKAQTADGKAESAQSAASQAAQDALTAHQAAQDAATLAGAAQEAADAVDADLGAYKGTVATTYGTKAELAAGVDGLRSEVGQTYATKAELAITDGKATTAQDAADGVADDLSGYQATVEQTYATKTALTQTAEQIATTVEQTYATKGQVSQSARPNLMPLLSMPMGDVYHATTSPDGYWYDDSSASVTNLTDGWAHVEVDNSGGGSTAYVNLSESVAWNLAHGGLKPSTTYTVLAEVRGLDVAAASASGVKLFGISTHAAAPSYFAAGRSADLDHDGEYRFVGTTVADLSAAVRTTRSYVSIAAGASVSLDLRLSLFEGDYAGPYKPYVDQTLISRMSSAESSITQQADAISAEVTARQQLGEQVAQASTQITQTATDVTTIVGQSITGGSTLWYAKSNDTAPAAPTSRVTSTSTAGGAWRTVVPAYSASTPHYFCCQQWERKALDGTTSWAWGPVQYDRAVTDAMAQGRQGVADAATAQSTAQSAAQAAQTADGKATSAQTTAQQAQQTADAAQSTAQTAATTAAATSTMIRDFDGGTLVCRVGQPIGALVSADGRFEVVHITWDGTTPIISPSGSHFAEDEIALGLATAIISLCDGAARVGVMDGVLRIGSFPDDPASAYQLVGVAVHDADGEARTDIAAVPADAQASQGAAISVYGDGLVSVAGSRMIVSDSAPGNSGPTLIPMSQVQAALAGGTYTASASVAISSTSVSNLTAGPSVSLPAGTYVVVGRWAFGTADTTGDRNCRVSVGTSPSGLWASNRAYTKYNYAVMEVTCVRTIDDDATVTLYGSSSSAYSQAETQTITALRIR